MVPRDGADLVVRAAGGAQRRGQGPPQVAELEVSRQPGLLAQLREQVLEGGFLVGLGRTNRGPQPGPGRARRSTRRAGKGLWV